MSRLTTEARTADGRVIEAEILDPAPTRIRVPRSRRRPPPPPRSLLHDMARVFRRELLRAVERDLRRLLR